MIYCNQIWDEELALYSECTFSILNYTVSKIHCKSSKFCERIWSVNCLCRFWNGKKRLVTVPFNSVLQIARTNFMVTQFPIQWVPRIFPKGVERRGIRLKSPFHLVRRLREGGAKPPLCYIPERQLHVLTRNILLLFAVFVWCHLKATDDIWFVGYWRMLF